MKNHASSAEKKLELLHQIRSQYQKNQYDLMRRESILYGQSSTSKYSESPGYFPDQDTEAMKDTEGLRGGLKLRYALAALLVFAVIFCDQRSISLWGVSTQSFFGLLQQDCQETLEAWADALIVDVRRTQ